MYEIPGTQTGQAVREGGGAFDVLSVDRLYPISHKSGEALKHAFALRPAVHGPVPVQQLLENF
ncbi:MAG TPA: hypothetical protein VEQ11_06130 [Chloroflexota bacterium]|nr:hypothetical protein [Chloroflexota bacterium]